MVRGNEVTLEDRYENDPELLKFYQKQFLQPGWAGGELSCDWYNYIRSQLQKSPSPKCKWGFKPTAKRLSEKRIWVVARDGLSPNER